MPFAQAMRSEARKISALVTADTAGSSAGEFFSVSAGVTAGTTNIRARMTQRAHRLLMVLMVTSGSVVAPVSNISLSFYPGKEKTGGIDLCVRVCV